VDWRALGPVDAAQHRQMKLFVEPLPRESHVMRMTRMIAFFAMATSAAVSAGCANGPTIDRSAPIPTCEALQLDPAVDGLVSPVLRSFGEQSPDTFEATFTGY
jgi:hypothetical protein